MDACRWFFFVIDHKWHNIWRNNIHAFVNIFRQFSLSRSHLICFSSNVANSSSAYDILAYAQNVKSTLKRTISCDSDNQSIVSLTNDFYLSEEKIAMGKLQITINYNA